jgi:hypothetical protein
VRASAAALSTDHRGGDRGGRRFPTVADVTGDEEPVPRSALLALVVGGTSAVPLLFVTAVAWAYAGDLAGGPVLAVALLALTVAQVAGVVLLRNRRSWQLLVGTSLGVVVAVPVAVVATSVGTSEPVAETVGSLAFLLAAPVLTVWLASQPGARRWGSPPRRLPAVRQPAPGQDP